MLSPDAVEHAIWHVKSLRKQDKQNALYDQLLPAGTASSPSDKHTSEP